MADVPKLLGFGLANYRSFGETGFVVGDIKKVNVFIGKNNSGKSNVLRAISQLRRLQVGDRVKGIDPLEDHHRRRPIPPSLTVRIPTETFLHPAINKIDLRSLDRYRRALGEQ